MQVCEMCLSYGNSLPICFDSCYGHHQGNLQDYKESKQTVKMHK